MSEETPSPISARRVIIISFLVDVSDLILSLVVTILSGSVVMLAQVLEGAADLASSGLLFIGIQKSKQKEDKTHPFGYGRELYFWTLISALVMFGITATFSVYFGIERIIYPEPISHLNLAYAILVLTTLTNGYAFSLSTRRLLKKHHPKQLLQVFFRSSLVETKTTFVLDAMGTLASILGFFSLLIYQLTGDLRFDGIGAVVNGLLLAVFAYIILIGAKDLIVGIKASPEVESRIKQTTLSVPQVKEILDLKTMHIGSEKLLVNLEVNLDRKLTTREIEQLIDDIKNRIRAEVPTAHHIQIELETAR